MTIIFLLKISKFDVDSRNWTKNLKKFFVFKIIKFELQAADSDNLEQDNKHP